MMPRSRNLGPHLFHRNPQYSSIIICSSSSLHLVTRSPRLRNDSLQLIDLSLRTSERSQLEKQVSASQDPYLVAQPHHLR